MMKEKREGLQKKLKTRNLLLSPTGAMGYSGILSGSFVSPAHHPCKTNYRKSSLRTMAIRNESIYRRSSSEEKKVLMGTSEYYAWVPVVFSSGKGCKLYVGEVREYLDLTSGIVVDDVGHSDPDWRTAMAAQLEVELEKRLVANSFADRAFFCNSETEANESAVAFSRKFQRFLHPEVKDPPTEIITFSNSFHGRTMKSLELKYNSFHGRTMESLELKYGDSEAAVDLIRTGKIAAVFVEPLQVEGGIHSADKSFLQSLRDACNEVGCLLVFDEVQCGLGRTGRLWAHEEYDVYPDVMTLGKPLAGGLHIGVVLVTERIASTINLEFHDSTLSPNALTCGTANVVFDKISNADFLASVMDKGCYFKQSLLEKVGAFPHVREIRGRGLIIGIELDVPADPLVDACRKAGVLVLTAGEGNVVRIVPSLNISKEEMDKAVEILVRCFPFLG